MTGYRVYRNDSPVASVGADVNAYADASSGPATSYRVSAINAVGEGPKSLAALPSVPASGCTLPGIMVADDTIDTVPNAPPQPQVDVKTMHVAEPYGDGDWHAALHGGTAGGARAAEQPVVCHLAANHAGCQPRSQLRRDEVRSAWATSPSNTAA